MENIHKTFLDEIVEAEKFWQSADHLIYITLPIVKDPKLMIRALENLHRGVVKNISLILKFEYLYKRVQLSKDSKKNLEIFFRKCAGRYSLGELDKKLIKDIVILGRKHKESGVEFSKSGKVIILDDNLGTSELTLEKMKEYLQTGKRLLENTNRNFKSFI